jgi:trk system potassium uptake protein TrkA
MKVVILGCGRVGARLAQLMEAEGHEISIIDTNLEAFDRLPETFKGQTVLGTGIDADVLKAAGIEEADSFAAVTNYDNTNIMASQIAKEIFGVPHVLARIYDPGRESLYHELGLETICPTTLVSTTARDILNSLAEQPRPANIVPIGTQISEGRNLTGPLASPPETTDDQTRPEHVHVPGHPDHKNDNGKRLRGLFNRNV